MVECMWPFKKSAPKKKSQWNVGDATVIITERCLAREYPTKWTLEFKGHVTTECMGGDLMHFYHAAHTAKSIVEKWRAEGSSGTLRVADNTYIPLDRIERIDVEYRDYLLGEV